MKRVLRTILATVICGLTLALSCQAASAQSAAFTYQGHLDDGDKPANGQFEMTFALFGSAIAVSPVSRVLRVNVSVVDGRFTTVLDYGAAVLDGSDYWIEVGVKGDRDGGFTILRPRQRMTAAPHAVHAKTADRAVSVSGEVVLANSTAGAPQAGAMRWTGGDFEGYNGSEMGFADRSRAGGGVGGYSHYQYGLYPARILCDGQSCR